MKALLRTRFHLKESTAQQFTFERSHVRVSSTESKFRTILYNVMNITKERNWCVTFLNLYGFHLGFLPEMKLDPLCSVSKILPVHITWIEIRKIYITITSF